MPSAVPFEEILLFQWLQIILRFNNTQLLYSRREKEQIVKKMPARQTLFSLTKQIQKE